MRSWDQVEEDWLRDADRNRRQKGRGNKQREEMKNKIWHTLVELQSKTGNKKINTQTLLDTTMDGIILSQKNY